MDGGRMNIVYHFFFWILTIYRFGERTRFVKKERAAGKVMIKHFYSLMAWFYFGLAFFNYVDFIFSQRRLNLFIFSAGLALYGLAGILRHRAMRTLNRMFSPDIEIRKDHQLVQEGPYSYVRHPLLLALSIETLANAVMANSLMGIILVISIYWPLIASRKYLEEKELLNHLGDTYRKYQLITPAFFPVKKLWKK
jgi:protein-S-isoprenylcysteine O-methyltransferase Ste14